MPAPGESVRLAEIFAALSLATDLADGHPWEKAPRTVWLATGTARELGLGDADCADVYYTALLRFIGCTSFAPEEAAALGGDDVAARRIYGPVDFSRPTEVVATTVRELAKDAGAVRRARAVTKFLSSSSGLSRQMAVSHCEVATRSRRAFTGARASSPRSATCTSAGTERVFRERSGASRSRFPRGSCSSRTWRRSSIARRGERASATSFGSGAEGSSIRRRPTRFSPAPTSGSA